MKRFAAIALIVLAGAFTAGTAQAQSHEVRATVPFNFLVGSKQFPAGSYSFVTEPNDTIIVRNSQEKIAVLSRTYEASELASKASLLVFNKYGDQYFLREIHCPTIATNVEIPPSKLEKQVRVQRAWLGPERTLLAMN